MQIAKGITLIDGTLNRVIDELGKSEPRFVVEVPKNRENADTGPDVYPLPLRSRCIGGARGVRHQLLEVGGLPNRRTLIREKSFADQLDELGINCISKCPVDSG